MRINREIQAPQVRVISETGSQVGVISLRDAQIMAHEAGLDLVEISPNANPPVCKIIDYGKYRYQKTKKEKEGKKSQHQVKVKEIKVKPNIDVHDYQTKLKHAKEFLTKGNKVRVTCSFRGREMLHTELGDKLLERFCGDLEEYSVIEAPKKRMGRSMSLVLAPALKKKTSAEENNKQGDKISAKNENEKSA